MYIVIILYSSYLRLNSS